MLICLIAMLGIPWSTPAVAGEQEARRVPGRVLAELKDRLESPGREEGHQEKWERYSKVIRKARGYLLEYEGAENLYRLRHVLLMALQARINLESDMKTYRMLLETARAIMDSDAPQEVKVESDLVLLREKIRKPEEKTAPAWRLILDFIGRYAGTSALGKALLFGAMTAEAESRKAVLNIAQQELRDRRAFWDVPMATGFIRRRSEANLSGRTLNTVTETLDGNPYRAPRNVLGKVTVLHFWAGGAPASLEGIGRLKEFYGKHKQHVRVVGIGMDSERSVTRRAIDQHDLPWTQTFSGQGPNDQTALNYGVFGLPSVIYLDPLGRTRRLKGLGGHYGRKPSTALENGYREVVRKATREIRRYETLNDVVKRFTAGDFLDRMTGDKFSSSAARKLYKNYRGTLEEIPLAPEERVEARKAIRNFMEPYAGTPSETAAVILGGLLSVQAGRDAMMHEIGDRLAKNHAEVPQARSFLRYVLDRHVQVGRRFEAKLKRVDGKSLELPAHRKGKVRVVCFWDAESMKEFQSLPDAPSADEKRTYPYTELSPEAHEDLEVIGVHLGTAGEEAKKMMKKRSGWIHTRIADPGNHPLVKRLDLYEYPSIWIIGREGRVLADDMLSAQKRSPILSAALHQPAPSQVRERVAGPWRVLGPFDQRKMDGIPESGYLEPPGWVKTGEARRSWVHTSWMDVPWHENERRQRFSSASFPVAHGEKELDFDATYDDGRGNDVGWHVVPADRTGFIDLDAAFDDNRPLPFAHAVTYVHSSKGGTYQAGFTGSGTGILRINGNEFVRFTSEDKPDHAPVVWVAGQQVPDRWKEGSRYTTLPLNRHILTRKQFEVRLREGWNEIYLKTWDVWGDWRFQLRFHDPDRTLRYGLSPGYDPEAYSGALPQWKPRAKTDRQGRLFDMLDGPGAGAIVAAAFALGDFSRFTENILPKRRDLREKRDRRLERWNRAPNDTLAVLNATQLFSVWTPIEKFRKAHPDKTNREIALKVLKPDGLFERLASELKDLRDRRSKLEAKRKKRKGENGWGREERQAANRIARRKAKVVEALGLVGNDRAVPLLVEEFKRQDNKETGGKVTRELIKAAERLEDPAFVPHLLPGLDADHKSRRKSTMKILARIDGEDYIPDLIEQIGKPKVMNYADQDVVSMGHIDHPAAVRWLKNESQKMLDKGHAEEKRAVKRVRALSRHGGSKVIDELLRYLDSEEMMVRRHAIQALGRIGDPEAVPDLLEELARSGSRELRHFIVRALERIGDPRATEPVAALLSDESYGLRVLAARALQSIDKNTDAVPGLIDALKDPHWLVRVTAAETLGSMKATKAVDPLIGLLKDKHSSVRRAAAEALGKMNAEKARKPLAAVLSDWQAGPHAAEALDRLGWKPGDTADHRVHFRVANRNGSALVKNWRTTKKVLYEDLKQGGKPAINAAFALIALGKDESVSPLTSYLKKTGQPAVATALLNSGNAEVSEKAEKWAQKAGRHIRLKRRAATVEWGEWQ